MSLSCPEPAIIAMPPTTDSRLGPRGETTRLALIHAAEMLFADHGIDGVGVRQIARAAGSANSNVVAYHFGGKAELAAAVILHRLPPIEERRAALLEASGDVPLSIAALLDILYRPLLDQADIHGRRSYARFLAGIGRSGGMAVRAALGEQFPVTQRLIKALCDAMPESVRPAFPSRLRVVAAMIHGAIAMMDDGAEEDPPVPDFGDMLSMAAAALCAPTADGGRT